jgi:YD repeat-containing protein
LVDDIDDRVTNSIDANAVSITTTYDNLGRMLNRTYPDSGVEKWGYEPLIRRYIEANPTAGECWRCGRWRASAVVGASGKTFNASILPGPE